MQLTVKATLTSDQQKLQKDLTVSVSDTPLTILLEVLRQAKLMQASQNFSVEPNRQGLRLGDAVWQICHAGKALDLLQCMLLVPEAQQAGAAGFVVEVLPVLDEAASLRKEVEKLRLAQQQWEKQAQEAATRIKQFERRPAAPAAGGALSARRELDQMKQELQTKQQEWDVERQNYEQQLAALGTGGRPAGSGQRPGVMMKNPPPGTAVEELGRAQEQWKTERKEYERIIAELQGRIAELEQGALESRTGANAHLTSDEVSEIEKQLQQKQEELEKEAQQIVQQREELEAMEDEFRNMEVKTSRERAEMNRQRADFQRLQRQFDFLLSQAAKKPDIEKAMAPVIQLREQIRKTTGV
jgi:hypothetical protein